jgi:hypothetical protein
MEFCKFGLRKFFVNAVIRSTTEHSTTLGIERLEARGMMARGKIAWAVTATLCLVGGVAAESFRVVARTNYLIAVS